MLYKYIDIVGTSNTNITDAVNNAFHEASRTVKNIKWGEMGRVTFRVEQGERLELALRFKEIRKGNHDNFAILKRSATVPYHYGYNC